MCSDNWLPGRLEEPETVPMLRSRFVFSVMARPCESSIEGKSLMSLLRKRTSTVVSLGNASSPYNRKKKDSFMHYVFLLHVYHSYMNVSRFAAYLKLEHNVAKA